MGIFNFVKDVGEKIFGSNDEPQAENIKENVEQFDLGVSGLQVEVQGDKVVLNGQAESQEALEKAVLAAGNTQGIAQVESNIEVASATGVEPVFYTVKSGDYLSKIAKEFYGDAGRYNEIFEANKPMLSDPDKIYPGQVLRISGATTAQAA